MMLMKTADSIMFAYICARVLICTCNKNQVLRLVREAWVLVLVLVREAWVLVLVLVREAWVLVLVLEALGTCYISVN